MAGSANADACLRCGELLEDGYLLDEGHGRTYALRWVKGPPDRGFFGMRLKNRAVLEVEALRCRACGWLDLRAPKR